MFSEVLYHTFFDEYGSAMNATLKCSSRGILSRIICANSKVRPLSRSNWIGPEDFYEQYLSKSRPVLLSGLIKDSKSPYRWPACDLWKGENNSPLSGLRHIESIQNANVDVEVGPIGRGYGDGIRQDEFESLASSSTKGWMQLRMPFSIFQDAFIDGKIPWDSAREASTSNQTQPELVGYVAQQDLFDLVPILSEHCPPLPHSKSGKRKDREQWRRNVWIGGAGTFTPIHCDPYENLFAQIVGTKRVHIFPPSVGEQLYLFDRATKQSNTSSIPTENPLLDLGEEELIEKFPLAQMAIENPGACHAILEPGDVLYIPKGWFHCVASLSVSASVNAWFR